MKKYNNMEFFIVRCVIAYLIFMPLFAWWAQWIIPHYLDRNVGFWPLYGSLCLINLIIPRKIQWVVTFILGISTIGIWLNIV